MHDEPTPPPVALTMGDACGIGPEIVAKLFRDSRSAGCFVLGDVAVMRRAAPSTGTGCQGNGSTGALNDAGGLASHVGVCSQGSGCSASSTASRRVS